MAKKKKLTPRTLRSAPQYPTVLCDKYCTRLGAGAGVHVFRWMSRISFLAGREGKGKWNSRSNLYPMNGWLKWSRKTSIENNSYLPGLRSAGSMASNLFVAPIIITSPRESRPSIRAKRVDTMLEWIWSWRVERTGARPSISSKKIMEGRIW